MKKLLVSLMAVSILSVGAANAGTLSNALNNAANKVGQREQSLTNACLLYTSPSPRDTR